MRNWCNNLTPNLSISPSWFLAQLRPLTRQKNPWTCTSWPDGRIISMGNQFSPSVMSDSLRPHGLQYTRPPCPSLTPRACSNSCPLSQEMPSNHLILCRPLLLLPSVFPSIRVFSNESVLRIRWPKYWSSSFNQSIGVSASISVLPLHIQDWSPLGWTGWISLLSKGLSRVFCNTTVQKHQFFSTQFPL